MESLENTMTETIIADMIIADKIVTDMIVIDMIVTGMIVTDKNVTNMIVTDHGTGDQDPKEMIVAPQEGVTEIEGANQ